MGRQPWRFDARVLSAWPTLDCAGATPRLPSPRRARAGRSSGRRLAGTIVELRWKPVEAKHGKWLGRSFESLNGLK